MNQISSIIRKATRQNGERLNVLSWVVHERFQSNLKDCNCNFYLLQNGPGAKGAWKVQYAPVPNNTVLLPNYQNNPLEVVPPWVGIDIIYSHHKFGILQTALQLSQMLGVPVCNIEHTMPTNDNLRKAVPEMKKLNGDINVFISHTSREQWGYTEGEALVIEHGIDSNFFKPSGRQRKQQILTVGNDMINRAEILGFDIFQRVTQGLPTKIVGDTQGLSAPAQNVYQLKQFYDESLIYFNPSRYSPIPMSLLEAAAVGCAVLTTNNNLISDIFTDGHDCVKTNDESRMRSTLQDWLNNPEECRRLGNNARETIVKRFNLDRFVSQWDEIFKKCLEVEK